MPFATKKSSSDRWGNDPVPFSSLAIHVGLHKTGTTSIQYELDRPLTNTFAFYVPWVQHEQRALISPQLGSLAKRLRRTGDSTLRNVLISNEGIIGTYIDGYRYVEHRLTELHNLFSFADPQIILTIRSPETWIRSCFVDYVKQGGKLDYGNFAQSMGETPDVVVNRVLEAAESIFQNVLIIDSGHCDVVDEIAGVVGSPPIAKSAKNRKRWNKSLSDQEIELIRSLNISEVSAADRDLVVWFLASESDRQKQKMFSHISQDTLKAVPHVRQIYSQPSRQLRETFRWRRSSK